MRGRRPPHHDAVFGRRYSRSLFFFPPLFAVGDGALSLSALGPAPGSRLSAPLAAPRSDPLSSCRLRAEDGKGVFGMATVIAACSLHTQTHAGGRDDVSIDDGACLNVIVHTSGGAGAARPARRSRGRAAAARGVRRPPGAARRPPRRRSRCSPPAARSAGCCPRRPTRAPSPRSCSTRGRTPWRCARRG